jgi:hypothetical protein
MFQIAYKVTFALVVKVPTITEPAAEVDQPAKVYPVLAMVPTVDKVTAVEPVVYLSEELVCAPVAPLVL